MMPSVDEIAGQSLLDASEMYKFCGLIINRNFGQKGI